MITCTDLTKRYGTGSRAGRPALDGVSFTVEPGTITGFLGPNGAGKSTTMRILLGLSRPSSGTALIGGREYVDLPNPGLVVGALLDADCFHPGRTGRESLRLAALTMGLPATRVGEVAERVGLSRHELGQRVRAYSLGMRQRLGLAQALLGDPQALVLDEPTNGLDPQGQRWLAELLRGLAERGCAVLLSSHQLPEVERIADRLVMIGAGRILASGSVSELRAEHGDIDRLYFEATNAVDRAA